MRQALNNLQSTVNGFNIVTSENVFKVCDEPHPLLIQNMLELCMKRDIIKAFGVCFKFYFNHLLHNSI
jgi:replication factor C subunit 2/4